jgi:hypothetical protein
MKSRIILQNNARRGFLTFEALLALTLFCMLIPAAIFLNLSSQKLMQYAEQKMGENSGNANIIYDSAKNMFLEKVGIYQDEFGKNTCEIGASDIPTLKMHQSGITLGQGIVGTSLLSHNGYMYESANSSVQSKADLFIINTNSQLSSQPSPYIVSSLNTGPGIASLAMSGVYLFLANESSVSQLQIVRVTDRVHPTLIAQLKLPLPHASSTAPKATSIFFEHGMVYLGTAKWDGSEFNIIDVSNPTIPTYVGGFKVGAQVNSITTYNGYAYIATSGVGQLTVLDVHDPFHISKVSIFSPDGSTILDGHGVLLSSTTLYFSRNGGGFNNTKNYELFLFDLQNDPQAQNPLVFKDIPGGVYGTIVSGKKGNTVVSIATGNSTASIQFLTPDLTKTLTTQTLPSNPIGMVCDHGQITEPVPTEQGFIYQST